MIAVFGFAFVFTTTTALASLTFSSTAITGTADTTIDVGAGQILNLQTTNNGNILTGSGNFGIGTTPSTKLHVLGTTEQLRLGYDSSNYWSSTIGSTGALTLAGTGTGGALTITPTAGQNVNVSLSTTGDFAVNTNQLYVDTSLGYVGIGTITPAKKLNVVGDISGSGTVAAGAGTDFFVNDFNQTATAGANNQMIGLMRLRPRASNGAFTGVLRPLLVSENSAGGLHRVQIWETGIRIGNYSGGTPSIVTPSANLELKGFGNDSSTFSIKATNSSDTAIFTVRDDGSVMIPVSQTPASAAATCTTGTVAWDSSYVYVCTATNTWKRAAIATW